jgi:hypothetical protein
MRGAGKPGRTRQRAIRFSGVRSGCEGQDACLVLPANRAARMRKACGVGARERETCARRLAARHRAGSRVTAKERTSVAQRTLRVADEHEVTMPCVQWRRHR